MAVALWILVGLAALQVFALAHLSSQLADFYRIVNKAIEERRSRE